MKRSNVNHENKFTWSNFSALFFAANTEFFAEETREAALVDFFNMQRESSNEEGLKIYNDTEKMNEAIKKAQNESSEKGLSTLNHALAAYKKV